MKPLLVFLAVMIQPTLSYADIGWTVDVQGIEANFGCNGTTPDLSTVAVNVSAGDHGEFRVKLDTYSKFVVATQANIKILSPGVVIDVGTLHGSPACVIEDAGEPATASWVEITRNEKLRATLTFTPGPSTCRPAPGPVVGFLRTNTYRLYLSNNGKTLSPVWQEDGFYHSLDDCRNASF